MVPRCRVIGIGVLAAPLLAPLILSVVSLLPSSNSWRVWGEADRLGGLLGTSGLLALLSCLVAVPIGTVLAVALERRRVPGAAVVSCLLLIGLFLPLPVHAVAWQVVLGSWLPPLSLTPGEVAWRPWSQGLLPAAWVHGVAGLPWVVWIVRAGLRTTDPTLEDDARLLGGSRVVFRRVILPRLVLGVVLSCGWLTVQTATEIPVTDAMMVRTFAEETYTRFVSGGNGVAEALAITVPVWFASILLVTLLARHVVSRFDAPPAASLPTSFQRSRSSIFSPTTWLVWLVVGGLMGLPLLSLVWKASGGGTRDGWDATHLAVQIDKVIRADGWLLVNSTLTSLLTGVVVASLAWVACWAVARSRRGRAILGVLCVVLWLTPGPIVGLSLLDAIHPLLDVEDWFLAKLGLLLEFPPLRSMLYDQPSPIPAMWAALMRFFPLAVVAIWPSIRAIPTDLLDTARLDGFGWRGEWRLVVWPLTSVAFLRASIAVAALALGEVSASKIVNPPFRSAFILRLFDQMHYGAESTVAALCLLQIAATTLAAGAFLWLAKANPR